MNFYKITLMGWLFDHFLNIFFSGVEGVYVHVWQTISYQGKVSYSIKES